jgi:hypothetical protein
MSFEEPESLSEFFDRVAAGTFPAGPTEDFLAYRRQCEARYAAGETQFGDQWRYRDNRAEAAEEAADLANYAAFDYFQQVANEGDDEDIDLVLTAARYGYLAYKAFRDLNARRRGCP